MRDDLKKQAADIQAGVAHQMHPEKFAVWLEELIKDAEANALRKAAEEVDWEWESAVAEDGHKSIYQHGKTPSQLLVERADRLDATRVIRAEPLPMPEVNGLLDDMEDRASAYGSAMNVFQTAAWANQVVKDNQRLIKAIRAFDNALNDEENES